MAEIIPIGIIYLVPEKISNPTPVRIPAPEAGAFTNSRHPGNLNIGNKAKIDLVPGKTESHTREDTST